jgi:glucose 1-dehydrogenase
MPEPEPGPGELLVDGKAWDQIERIGRRTYFAPERVLVTGAGPIGLLAALLGVQRGLEVHVLDRDTDGPKPALVADLGGLNRDIVLENDVVFGTVNANLRHCALAADALARADRSWLERMITRRLPL